MLMKMNAMMSRRDKQKGFTLVELIVVMAILAILAALAVPKFTNVLGDAQTKANTANLDMLQNAVDLYIANEQATPDSVDDFTNVISEGYLKAVPDAPTGSTAYKVVDGVVSNT